MAAIQPISEKIRSFRSKNNLSQQDFAFLCGISTSYLSQIENAAANPSLILLERISSVLGTTVGDLATPERRSERLTTDSHSCSVM